MLEHGVIFVDKFMGCLSESAGINKPERKQLSELYPLHDQTKIKSMVDAAMAGISGRLVSDTSLFTGTATYRKVEYLFSPVHQDNQVVCKIEFSDLTYSALESYRQNGDMLDNLLCNLPGMVVRFKNNLDWTTEFISEGALELTGYLPDEFLNQSVLYGRITNPEDNIKVYRHIQTALAEGEKYTVDYRITAKNGEEKWVWEQGRGIYDAEGNVQSVECFVTDITHYKLALKERKQSEQKYRSILEAIPDLVFIQDNKGTYLDFYRQKNVDWVYLDPKEMMGRSMHEMLPQELAEQMQQKIDLCIATKTPQKLNYSLPIRGKETFFESTVVSIDRTTVLRLVRNISDIVIAEKALSERNQELDAFVYKVSHDLKAPLKSIKGLVSLLKHYDGSENTRQMAGMIEESIHKMDAFIQTSLSYTQSLSVPIRPESFDPKELIERNIDEVRHMPGAASLSINIDINQKSNAVQDVFRLGTIIKNLSSNAFKYRNPSITDSFLNFAVTIDEAEMIWKISDNGIGVSDESKPNLFQMFYRATTRGEGTGLGLHIVKLSVEKMGGTIDFSSEEGKGTSFLIKLPNLAQ